MAKYIERDALLKSIANDVAPFNIAMVFRHIHNAPAADVVPVVRCKDCEYRDTIECAFACGMLETTDDSFCSYGKAKMGREV